MLNKNKFMKKCIGAILTIGVILMPGMEAKAAEKSTSINIKEVEKFTDYFFQENMDKYHVPGAAIAFVKDGEVSFMKGYGYSDVENKISVDPEKTVFGIASVSKLLTSTAVMQQYEEGKIDLDKDVNEYLSDFKIGNTFKEPITMKNLLTHTSGFIQSSIGIGTRNQGEIKKLGDYLSTGMPEREYKPNQFFSYSNQGMSLAGNIVELTSGKSFEDYIDNRIFEPLNMKSSSFKQPLPESMEINKAVGYGYWTAKGSLFRTESMYYQILPAGASYTTVSDMSKFIIANLNGGKYEGKQLLRESTMEEMHSRQFAHNDKMPGQAYGFWESFENNKRGLFHTGTSDGCATLLYIMPEENIGFILSYNLATDRLRTEFLSSFLDKFYPVSDSKAEVPANGYKERVKNYEGLYWNVEKPRNTIDKLEVLMSDGLVRIKGNEDGILKLTGYYGDDMGEYIEIEPGVLKKVNGEEIITFEENSSNNNYLFIKNNAFEKVKWYENPAISIIMGIASLLIIMVSFIIFIRSSIKKKNKNNEKNNLEKYALYIGLITSTLIIVFCTVAAIITLKLGKYAFMFGIPLSIKLILLIPILLCPITIYLVVISILAWKNSYWTRFERVFFNIYALAVTMFMICLKFWNMIGL